MRTKSLAILSLAVSLISGLAFGGDVSLQVKGMYFMPGNSDVKDVYKGGPAFGGEIDLSLMKGLGIWAGGHIFSKTGNETFTEEETKLRLTPLYAGVRYRFGASRLIPYVGAGIAMISYKEEAVILGEVSGSAVGYVGQAGVIITFGKSVFIDLKAMYMSGKDTPLEVEADFSGFSLGLGAGIRL